MSSSLPSRIAHVLGLWHSTLRAPTRRLAVASFVAVLFVAAHSARIGTRGWRAAAASLLCVWVFSWLLSAGWKHRMQKDLRRAFISVIRKIDPPLADASLRALNLVDRTEVDPSAGSLELAQLHLARLVARVSIDQAQKYAARRARVLQACALIAASVALVAALARPFHVVEGLDILVAHTSRAPLPFVYLESLRREAHYPNYLHRRDTVHEGLAPMEVPYGTIITVLGTEIHTGRQLLLTNGETEMPFVDDGAGARTARWVVKANATLQIAARFGHVRIEQGEPLELICVPDRAPSVELEGAPRIVRLLEQTEIPIVYRASDDYGLREVNLVLRAGTREERRVLSRLEGETKRDEGGTLLRASDRFLKSTFLPMQVTVEARDNDPLTGPKWGTSAPITLVPPAVGEPEALRLEALIKARDRLVDLLAFRVRASPPQKPAERTAFATEQAQELDETLSFLTSTLQTTYGGLSIPRRVVRRLEGQLGKLRASSQEARRSIGKAAHEKGTHTVEDALLALDSIVRTLATRDAQTTARRLSKVAAEAADGLALAQNTTESGSAKKSAGLDRTNAALGVLEPSGHALARLGALGTDLGSIVANDLRRIHRAMEQSDLAHAELAARDLATRLSRPAPSFAGGGRSGGTEAGGSGKPDPEDQETSDAEQAMAGAEQALEELARDHAGNIADVEQALAQASQGEETSAFQEEAKRHAEAIRDAVQQLPRFGGQPDSPTAAASTARDQALQMAEALERGAAKDAVDTGHAAERSLQETARTSAPDPLSALHDDMVKRAARDASAKLAPEMRWAEEALSRMRQQIQGHTQVGSASNHELHLAERAKDLTDKSHGAAQGGMPDSALSLLQDAESKMRDAAHELGHGEIDKALAQQKEAQNLLEIARSPEDRQNAGNNPSEGGHEDPAGSGSDTDPMAIPKAEEHKGTEAFRQRVLEGLAGGSTPRLRTAVQRYAEKLLR